MKLGWGSKGQQRQVDSVTNQLNRVIQVGRMATVPLTNLSAQSDLKTRGAQVSFKVTSLQGVDSFVLMRNFSRDPGSAQQIHVWDAKALQTTPQTFPINLQHTDADPAIAGQKAYYWIKAVPSSNVTAENTFLSGPQLFDASLVPSAKQIAGDFPTYQAYAPTSNPLSAATGGSANHATISVASFQIQYPFDANGDGIPDLISYNSGSITPLLDNTLYFVYFDDPAYLGGAETYIASVNGPDTVAGLHRQFVGSVTTPAFGGGGTTGGAGHCFSGNTRVFTKRGMLPIEKLRRGDQVLTRAGWRVVVKLIRNDYDGVMHEMGSGELVKPQHRIWWKRAWVEARELFPTTVRFKGKVYNLEISAAPEEKDNVRCYCLGNGLYAHNLKPY